MGWTEEILLNAFIKATSKSDIPQGVYPVYEFLVCYGFCNLYLGKQGIDLKVAQAVFYC